jgi:hypothetical protein
MKLRVLVGVLGFLIILNLATIGTFLYVHFTRPPRPSLSLAPDEGFRGRPRAAGRPWLRRLPSEDREELVGLLREFHGETRDLRLKLRSLEDQIFDLMQNDPVSVVTVDSLLGEVAAVRLDISRVATRKLIEAKTILPREEQRMFFDSILQARPAPRGMHGPGPDDEPFSEERAPRGGPDSLQR